MKKLFIFYMLYMTISAFNHCFAMQMQSVNLAQYDQDLIEATYLSCLPINDIEEDRLLGEKVFALLNQQPVLAYDTISKRQILLKTYLERIFPKAKPRSKESFDLSIQGEKLNNALASHLIYYDELWHILEQGVQKYCQNGSCRMSKEEHCIYNDLIFKINKAYGLAIQNKQKNQNTLFYPEFFKTLLELSNTIGTINSFY